MEAEAWHAWRTRGGRSKERDGKGREGKGREARLVAGEVANSERRRGERGGEGELFTVGIATAARKPDPRPDHLSPMPGRSLGRMGDIDKNLFLFLRI